MSKKNSLINHPASDLQHLVASTRDELRDLRFSAQGGKNRNVKLVSSLRKTVARALTELGRQTAEQAKAKKQG